MQKILNILWAMLQNNWKCPFNCVPWFFYTFEQNRKKCLVFGLSVCPSVCLRSNTRKYSSNILKLMCYSYLTVSMDRTENGIYITNGSFVEIHKVFRCITVEGIKFFKEHFNIYITLNVVKSIYVILILIKAITFFKNNE